MKKDSRQTPYELWYGYKMNVSYLKVFGSKCYILKKYRRGKFDVKGDEGMFLRYSCRSKAYRCLNLSTHKIIEIAHVKIDKFGEKSEEESSKDLEDYRRFFYYESNKLPIKSEGNEASPPELPKSPLATRLYPV